MPVTNSRPPPSSKFQESQGNLSTSPKPSPTEAWSFVRAPFGHLEICKTSRKDIAVPWKISVN